MPNSVTAVVDILKKGGVGILPTETVYGLAGHAFDPKAVARIFEIKKRPHFNPLIVHVATLEAARELTREFPEGARRLAEKFWPGPLTLVLPKSEKVSDLVTAGLPWVAIRIPQHPIALAVLQAGKMPLAAPSANPYQSLSPTDLKHVDRQLLSEVDFALDGGPCAVGLESTIISFADSVPTLLRPGGIELESVEAVVGKLGVAPQEVEGRPLAPGGMKRHYAPRTKLQFPWNETLPVPAGKLGYLGLIPPKNGKIFRQIECLSEKGDLREAASRLFDTLQKLDSAGLDWILAGEFPPHGLGLAINDRLKRAATFQTF